MENKTHKYWYAFANVIYENINNLKLKFTLFLFINLIKHKTQDMGDNSGVLGYKN